MAVSIKDEETWVQLTMLIWTWIWEVLSHFKSDGIVSPDGEDIII